MYSYSHLNSGELGEIKTICDKWLWRKNDEIVNKNMDTLFNYCKLLNFHSIINAYKTRLEKIPWKFTKSEEVSGSICFFGGVVTSLLNYGHIKEIEGLFTFAVCYMLIDHFLDDEKNTKEEKDKCIKEIYEFISTGIKNSNRLVMAIGDQYLELIHRVPRCKEFFLKLFQSELKGLKVQNNQNLTREDYLRAAEEKGGYTSLCIASIIGLEINQDNYGLGSLIQTPCDDLLDIKDDETSGIYTLVRYDIDHGNLDRYLYESFKKIDNLGPVYNFFKVILMSGIILGIHDNPGCISESLNEVIKTYDVYTGTSKEKLIEWFYNKLSEYCQESDGK